MDKIPMILQLLVRDGFTIYTDQKETQFYLYSEGYKFSFIFVTVYITESRIKS